MKIKNLKMISYIYLILPVIIFMLGWCKPVFSIPITIALLFVFKIIYDQYKSENESFIIPKNVGIIFGIVTILCILAGHGGLFYQSSDWDARNAIFRDLINEEWPVYYKKSNTALVYYIGQWMVPAVFGKMFLIFSENVAWIVGNLGLLLWNVIGVSLSVLWLIKILKLNERKKILFSLFIFLFFSGLDIVGIFVSQTTFYLKGGHLEWWGGAYQFSSMMTQLFWVFNQCIVPWLITLMVLEEKRVNNYMVLILLCLPFAPLPFVGLITIFACNGIRFLVQAIKEKRVKSFIKDVFSIQNILTLICILPIFAFYYFGNKATSENAGGGGLYIYREILSSPLNILKLFLFWFWEIGIYGVFLWRRHKKNPLYYTILISLLIIPIFRIGYAKDFAMRASIPGIVVISYWTISIWLKGVNKRKQSRKWLALTVVLVISLVTPGFEYYRAFRAVIRTGKINCVYDKSKTYTDKKIIGGNFITEDPKENSIFFKYVSRK